MSTKTKKPKLNHRQAAVIEKMVVEHKSATQAYAEVYPVKNSEVAQVNASRMLSNAKVQNALQESLHRHGHTEDRISEELENIRKQRDWRAKDAYVGRVSTFLGYGKEQTAPVAQVGNIVNNWTVEKK